MFDFSLKESGAAKLAAPLSPFAKWQGRSPVTSYEVGWYCPSSTARSVAVMALTSMAEPAGRLHVNVSKPLETTSIPVPHEMSTSEVRPSELTRPTAGGVAPDKVDKLFSP